MDVHAILDEYSIDYEETTQGKRLMVCCPFHDDTHPSGGIWADSGYFKCFAGHCGVTIDLAGFLAEATDLTPHEARRVTRGDSSFSELENNVRKFLHSDEDTFKYFSVKSFHKVYPPLTEGSAEWNYIIQRGISPRMIRRFDMRKGVKKYNNRVILPIYTPERKLVAYVGRSITDVSRKTLKSRSPHRALFGLYELVRNYPNLKTFNIVVVEGEFDAIYLQQFGIPAVANMGTMPMGFHKIHLLKKYAKRVILSYDGDAAGYTAMYGKPSKDDPETWIPGELENLGRYLRTISILLPEKMDPNNLNPKQVEETYGKYQITRV